MRVKRHFIKNLMLKILPEQLLFFLLAIFLFSISISGCSSLNSLKGILTHESDPAPTGPSPFHVSGKKHIPPLKLPVNSPTQITFEADPVLHAAVSEDGKWLAYSSSSEDSKGLWLRSADPDIVVLPELITVEGGTPSHPVFSPEGSMIAFAGNGYDVKGDIYLVSLDTNGRSLRRLTNRETEDGSPCFSRDSKTIYFHQVPKGDDKRYLAMQNLDSINAESRLLETGGDGSFPSISPDGTKIAFVSFRNDPNGDIFIFETGTGRVSRLTETPDRDLFPVWSPDGRYVYFSRFGLDTDNDGAITPADNAVIMKANVMKEGTDIFPLTSVSYSAYQSVISPKGIFFLSGRNGVSNVWFLPAEGEIPLLDSARAQTRLAEDLVKKLPQDFHLAILGYYKVLESYRNTGTSGADAALAIGKLYEKLVMEDAAERAFNMGREDFSSQLPGAALLSLHLIRLQSRRLWEEADSAVKRERVLNDAFRELEAVNNTYHNYPAIKARSLMVQAWILSELGQDPGSLSRGVQLLDQVIEIKEVPGALTAEAMLMRSDLFRRVGRVEDLFQSYAGIIKEFPDQETWADHAVSRILDFNFKGMESSELQDRIQLLTGVADQYEEELPRLAMGAWNRIGDAYFEKDEWTQAKAAYRKVFDENKEPTTQTAAARLALAEILFREERFRQALDLYETEMKLRPYEDRLYSLARAAYIRKSIASGEFLFRLGEVLPARNRFVSLIREDYSIVEAHRGYIKCAAAQKQIPQLLAHYRAELETRSNDPVTLYAAGLCLTYLEDRKSMEEARALIITAIQNQGQVEYFHQTLGYIYEVLETAFGERKKLESALESYRKAFFLNDPEQNPGNRANLLRNLGNAYFLLGQYGKAFESYSRRFETRVPFDHEETEILYFYRLGMSAFRVGEREQPVQAFKKAIDLIDKRVDPKRGSEVMGRINRYIADRILTPALQNPKYAARAKVLAEDQSGLNRQLFDISSGYVAPPPDPSWGIYRDNMETLVSQQEKIIENISFLVQSEKDESLETLGFMITQANEALGFTGSLMLLKTEMLDRLGLAYQETGRWKEAGEIFENAYGLNEQMGRHENLAANRRSIAYNLYMQAGTLSGIEKNQLLIRALKGFEKVTQLIRLHGVAGEEKQESDALFSIGLDISLDKISGTQAAFGFSADQEVRLAEAFISRIRVELGQLPPSRDAMDLQLSQYPAEGVIAPEDLYGVSLLYHRAGHLDHALKDPLNAFDNFSLSAKIAIDLENPVSAAINLRNMARALTQISDNETGPGRRLNLLISMDRKTRKLLDRSAGLQGRDVIPAYHNTMGVLFMGLKGAETSIVGKAATDMAVMQQAGIHLTLGLKYLEEQEYFDRKRYGLLSVLHLNMAELASILGEYSRAQEHLEAAFTASGQGMAPELEWRALAGLDRFEEALKVLETVSVLRAGCGPGEIIRKFSPMVMGLVDSNKIEDAFNLLEKLSELERAHRMAHMVRGIFPDDQKTLFRRVYPRILMMRDLAKDLRNADDDNKIFISERIKQEQEILDKDMGGGWEKRILKGLVSGSDALREIMVIVLGIAVHAEELADTAVRREAAAAEAVLMREEYQSLLIAYKRFLGNAKRAVSAGSAPGIAGMLKPDPVEAIDVMDNLGEKESFVRLFHIQGDDKGWMAFVIEPDDLRLERLEPDNMTEILDNPDLLIACENWLKLPSEVNGSLFLSAAHMVRSIENRKPFKRTVLAFPDKPVLPGYFKVLDMAGELSEAEIFGLLPETHTLLLNTPVYEAATVPVRPGEEPVYFMAVDRAGDSPFSLLNLLGNLSNTSLAILPQISSRNFYTAVHMFAQFGVPTIIISQEEQEKTEFLEYFFRAYSEYSAIDSFYEAGELSDSVGKWIQLGFKGMTSKEALVFAQKNFSEYVKTGIATFRDRDYTRSLMLFENALNTALETKALDRYLPDIYRYARESAYLSDRLDKAVAYAAALVNVLEAEKPDSEVHAGSLLKLGLVLARSERFSEAIPALEEAVEIIADLELEHEQIKALSDLGIVLENATMFDRALDQFESAVSLSQALNKKDLLAQQYVSIGRINDLRLSRYASARLSYKKAYDLYRELNNISGMAGALLDIGRCYRLMGNFKSADDNYKKALELVQGDNAQIRLKAKIHMEQANNFWFQGSYQDAFKLQKEVYKTARQYGWPLEQVMALNTSGLIWWTLGNNERALRELEDALTRAGELKARKDETATTLNNIGLVYRDMGRFDKALEILGKALAIDREINSIWAIAYDLKNLALTRLRMGEAEKAIPLFEEALEAAGSIGNRINEAKILFGLGEAKASLGRNDEARQSFEKALEFSQIMVLRETQWRALYGLGKLSLKEGRNIQAQDFLVKAIKIIEGMRAEIKVDQLKDGFADNKMAVYETLVSLLVDQEKQDEAFEVAERSRSRNLIDLLGNQHMNLHSTADQDLYNRQQVIRARIEEMESLLAQAESSSQSVYGQALKRLSDEYQDLMLEIQSKNPELASVISVNPLDLAGIQGLLEPGVALMTFYVLEDEVLCWLVKDKSIELYRTPIVKESLEKEIMVYRRMIQNLEPFESHSKELYDLLLSRIFSGMGNVVNDTQDAQEKIRVLGIIPHGILHYLSFATLYDGDSFAADRYSLFYLPSASVFRYTLDRRRENPGNRVLAIGNPDLDDPGLDLPFAEREVNSIGWNFPDITKLTRDRATESWVKEHINEYGIIHLASHGEFDPVNPLFSAVKLVKDIEADGDLETSEVFGLEINADLVVLSACQTGLGKVTGGDDVIGLNRAFLYGGSHAVLSSLWRVSDISTAILVKQFYRRYITENKSDSLRDAIRHVKNRYPHPGYWGAFVLVGDYY